MGCAKSQTISNDLKIPKQEQALIQAENSLLISRALFIDIYKEIKLNSSHNFIKRSQLERSLSQASAGLKSEIMQLSEEFCIKQNQYNAFKICAAIILLGNGDKYEKMKTFYHLIDEEALGFINNEQLKNSLENLTEIATENIPNFIKDKISPLLNVSEYLEFIKKEKKSLISIISNELIKGHKNVEEAEFCEKLCQDKYFSPIMNASRVRMLLHDMLYANIEPSKQSDKINENNPEQNIVKSKLNTSYLIKDIPQKSNCIEKAEKQSNKAELAQNHKKITLQFICQSKPIISISHFEQKNVIKASNKSKHPELNIVAFSSGSSNSSLSKSSLLPHLEEAKDEFMKYEEKFNLEDTLVLHKKNFSRQSINSDTLRPPSSQEITYAPHRNSTDMPFFDPQTSLNIPSTENSDIDVDFDTVQTKPRSSTQWVFPKNDSRQSINSNTLRPPSSQEITYGPHRNSIDMPFFDPRMSLNIPSTENSDMDIDFDTVQTKPRSSTQWAFPPTPPIKPIITNTSVKSTTPAGKYSVNSAIKVITSVPKEPLWKSNSAKTSPLKHRSSITNSQQSSPTNITLRVNVGPGKYENVTVGPNDDLLRVGQHFAAIHKLKFREREKLIRDLKMLKDKS